MATVVQKDPHRSRAPRHHARERGRRGAAARRGSRAAAAVGDRAIAQCRPGDVPRCRGLGGAGKLRRLALGVQRRSGSCLVVHAQRRAAQRDERNLFGCGGLRRRAGGELDVYRCESLDDQRWKMVPRGHGTFELRNVKRGLCLDVNGRAGARGDDVLLWACDGAADQLWSFEAYTPPPRPVRQPPCRPAAIGPRIRRRRCRAASAAAAPRARAAGTPPDGGGAIPRAHRRGPQPELL